MKMLGALLNGNEYDHPSKAAALNTLQLVRTALRNTSTSSDEQTKAHRAALLIAIDKALVIR